MMVDLMNLEDQVELDFTLARRRAWLGRLKRRLLSLSFNHEEFRSGHKARCENLPLAFFVGSSGFLERRIALGRPRAAAPRASGRSPTGFRRLRWCTHRRQECRKTPQHAGRGQPPGPLRSLPRQPPVGDDGARQPQLRVGGQDQPRPTVGLLGVPEPGSGPTEGLLQEPYGVFEVEPATVCLPEVIEIRIALPAPPQPELLRFAGLLGQLAHLHQDHGAPHDGCPLASVALSYAPGLRVQLRPRAHSYLAVVLALAAMLAGGLRPTRGVFEIELLAVASRAPHRPRLDLLGGCVEDPVGVQPYENPRGTSLQSALELHRIVAGIEDENGLDSRSGQPSDQDTRLLDCDLLGVLCRF